MLTDHAADVVALGKAALGNRDWPDRVRTGRPLDELDASLFAPVADVKDWELELLS
jgi:2,4-dienoyl-CoA reductase-like NADH-dependent reductase (Old Yellow Enzyme family)